MESLPLTPLTEDEVLGGIHEEDRLFELFGQIASTETKEFFGVLPGIISVVIIGILCRSFAVVGSGVGASSSLAIDLMVYIYIFKYIVAIYSRSLMKLEELNGYVTSISGVMVSFLSFDSCHLSGGALGAFTVILCSFVSFIVRLATPLACAMVLVGSFSFLGSGGYVSSRISAVYTTFVSAMLSVLTLIYTFQCNNASAKDSLLKRGAKLASSYAIPVVGGAISESFDSVSLGMISIKNSFGYGAALLIILSILPVLLSIILYKLFLALAGSMCDVSGSGSLAMILTGFDNMLNILLITVVLSSLTYLYSLFLFCGLGV